jgi:hypothetical protein
LSEVLTLSKQNYPHYQKVAYGVYMAAKKLKHYFEEHPITVVSTTPISEIIGCKDATDRVAKWVIELAAHTIQYKPRTTIKSQIHSRLLHRLGRTPVLAGGSRLHLLAHELQWLQDARGLGSRCHPHLS